MIKLLELDRTLSLIKNPEDFNTYLNNNFKYGFIYKGKSYSDNFLYYKTITPQKFNEQKMGVCWDYVAFEDYFFNKFTSLEYKLFYIESDNTARSTHTWLSYIDNDKLKSFESSWFDFRGIKNHTDQNSMIKYYIDNHEKFTGARLRTLIQFKQPKIFNLSPMGYMTYIYKHGVRIV